MKKTTEIFSQDIRVLSPRKTLLSNLSRYSDQVWDLQGEHLGKIKRLILDPLDGSCKRVVIAYGGTIGVGAKCFSVPLHDLTVSKSGVSILNPGNLRPGQ
ncbi:hypothetical protein DQQ10_05430 [Pseudochryseolinea flava]|uniref:PRC-barrel domain-containing protein n=1 Tax=Pseudochryseolinea flava TaxID=2059302 RepID=A0A364Y560_9BACT|nr:hypothetical protein DQQ10_05430 [Pseudochryseolinea flava]